MTLGKNQSSLNGRFSVALDANQALRLVQIKARQDALFRPLRRPGENGWAHAWIARRRYHTTGMAWRSRATDPAEAKEAERTIKALSRHALLRRFQPRALKTLYVNLTPLGDAVAGAMLGWDCVADARIFCAELHRLTTDADKPPTCWVREVALNDGRGWGDGNSSELFAVEVTALAALSRLWAESNSDAHGHVYYRLTPAGVRAVEDPEPSPTIIEPLENGEAIYWDEFDAAIQDAQSLKEQSRDIGEVPLSCSGVVAV